MKNTIAALVAVGLAAVLATPALADASPSTRDIQSAVDSYLAGSDQDVNLVGGPGSAGYDQGFFIQGGDFTLRINLTLQARYEAWLWDDDAKEAPNALPAPVAGGAGDLGTSAGDLSGFSLPRATLKFAGTAPCSISYYMELEFGHWGDDRIRQEMFGAAGITAFANNQLGPLNQSFNFDNTREAWIQWSSSDAFNVRMGQIRTATTRQMMIAPELQQFVDVSLASAYTGWIMPGYTDRNRDHGVGFFGNFGCNGEFSYLVTVTNGDGGDSIRNVLDNRTSDNLAYSARVNWAFLNPIGYQEGALRQQTCDWYGEVGAWVYYYADRADRAHTQITDALRFGVDLALGWGGFSFTGAATLGSDENAAGNDADHAAYLAQLGFHFPGTAWEIAARWSTYDVENEAPPFAAPGFVQPAVVSNGAVSEFAFGVNYYLNGHGNKLSLDVAFVSGSDEGSALLFDPYTGYQGPTDGAGFGDENYGILLRFQWQLAL